MEYSAFEIEKRIVSQKIGSNIIFLDEVDSTNLYAKNIANLNNPDGTVIIAEHQSAGRGRLDRKFFSPSGSGVYLSILLYPDLPIQSINTITLLAALASLDTVEELCGVRPMVKWPNDIYLNGKKLCGILTESAVDSNGKAIYVIVGIGVNISVKQNALPEEISKIATSILTETKKEINRADYVACLLKNFEKYYNEFPQNKDFIIKKYSNDMIFLNNEIMVNELNGSYKAKLIGINEDGFLLVKNENGEQKTIIGGEISIRPIK